ncbi:RHS repeat-associated core domain-containing protein, partial [Paenibacillus sp. yr247]
WNGIKLPDEWKDFFGERTTQYLYDGMDVLKEYGKNGNPLVEYYRVGNQTVAQRLFGNTRFIGDDDDHGNHGNNGNHNGWFGGHGWFDGDEHVDGNIVYGLTDALGSVRDVTNHKGKSLMQYRYDAFGNIVSGLSNPYTSAAMYAGKQYDPKAGLMDYSARWYNPNIGRFISQDTYIGIAAIPQSLNRYAYTLNNPVKYIDPSGHCPADENGNCDSGGGSDGGGGDPGSGGGSDPGDPGTGGGGDPGTGG